MSHPNPSKELQSFLVLFLNDQAFLSINSIFSHQFFTFKLNILNHKEKPESVMRSLSSYDHYQSYDFDNRNKIRQKIEDLLSKGESFFFFFPTKVVSTKYP
jgi:hypothetical protein